MFLEPLIVHPANVCHRMSAAVVFVVRVTATIFLVLVNNAKNFHETLFRVLPVVNQFIVELKNLGAKRVRVPLIIGFDISK